MRKVLRTVAGTVDMMAFASGPMFIICGHYIIGAIVVASGIVAYTYRLNTGGLDD